MILHLGDVSPVCWSDFFIDFFSRGLRVRFDVLHICVYNKVVFTLDLISLPCLLALSLSLFLSGVPLNLLYHKGQS